MIYTAPYVMLLMRADKLQGQVGGGWALEIETFLGPENRDFFGPCEMASSRQASAITLVGPPPPTVVNFSYRTVVQ